MYLLLKKSTTVLAVDWRVENPRQSTSGYGVADIPLLNILASISYCCAIILNINFIGYGRTSPSLEKHVISKTVSHGTA